MIKEMVEKEEIIEKYGKHLKLNDCRAARLVGYPKVHKEEVPL